MSKYKVYQVSDLDFVLRLIEKLSHQLKSPYGMKSCVFGGFVRDSLRGVHPNDMDVMVPNLQFAEAFVNSLKDTIIEFKKTITMDCPKVSSLQYSCFSMVIKSPSTPMLKIDVSYSKATSLSEDSLNYCDFTCNNLTMNLTGEISTRIKPWQIGQTKNYTEAEWLLKCIRDCVEGRLVWMIPDRFSKSMGATEASKAEFMDKMRLRLMKMQRKGFVLACEEDQYLTSFRLE